MIQKEQIEIPLSKKKIVLILFGSIVFVVFGVLCMINPSMFISAIFRNATIIFIAGLAAVVFFGCCAIAFLRKLSDPRPGLIISSEGILDNSSGVSAGLIVWSDITEIQVRSIAGQNFILPILRNPQDYIDKASSTFKRKAMVMNYKQYGSPVSISANTLQTKFDELYRLLVEKRNEYTNTKCSNEN